MKSSGLNFQQPPPVSVRPAGGGKTVILFGVKYHNNQSQAWARRDSRPKALDGCRLCVPRRNGDHSAHHKQTDMVVLPTTRAEDHRAKIRRMTSLLQVIHKFAYCMSWNEFIIIIIIDFMKH